jgi:signal transduction histidine kinase/AmiR/NasT family two-component response regulator
MKLHVKVFSMLLSIVAAIILITIAASLYFVESGLENTVLTQLTVIGQLGEKMVTSEMDLIQSQVNAMVEHLKSTREEDWQGVIERDLKNYKPYIGVAVLNRDGVLASAGSVPAPHDFYNSVCYKNARTGWNYITTTNYTTDAGYPVVFYFCEFIGHDNVLAVTIPGLYFSDILRNYKIWKTGSIYILDNEGTVIANPRDWMVTERFNPIKEMESEDRTDEEQTMGAYTVKAIKGGSGWGRYDFEGKERLAVFTPVTGTDRGWILGVSAPIKESPGGYLRDGLLLMGSIFLGFGLLASVLTTIFVTRQFKTINTQNSKLMELNEVAQSVSESKTAFLANMSHEMRTPLNAIVGFSELMLNGIARPEETEDNLTKIHNAGVILLGIVNDILDISKIESGKFEMIPVDYEIASLINDTVTINMIRIADKNIKFVLKVDPDLPQRLMGDELRIKQIMNNFLSNAFKYTKEGTVELSVSGAVNEDEVWLMIDVTDTGIGIKKEDIGKLFSAYNQVDTKSNRKIEGTGLGLSIAKRMAQMMGGTIVVESEYGKGSTFTATVRQKFVTHETIGKKVAQDLQNFNFKSKKGVMMNHLSVSNLSYARVLIVDDVQTNLDVARGMLKPYQMTIDCVTSGQAAVNLIKDETVKYDAIFMDHMMPEMDGIEAVRIIRHEIGTDYARNIPIIALTANALIGNEKMFMENGFQAYLAKPIDMNQVDKVLERWVRDKEKEKDLVPEAPKPQSDLKSISQFARTEPDAIPGVNVEAGAQRFGGDMEIYRDTLRSYATNTYTLLDKVRNPSEENLKDYLITVHGIKSSSLGIMAESVGKAAMALENAAKENNLAYITEHNDSFVEATEKLIEDIRNYLGIMREAESKDSADSPDPELVSNLVAACQNYDMDGVDAALKEISKHTYRSDPGLVDWLKEKADMMELDEIIAKFDIGGAQVPARSLD